MSANRECVITLNKILEEPFLWNDACESIKKLQLRIMYLESYINWKNENLI